MIELTEEQRTAVYSDEHELVVVAAAGSGKTRVLTERFIKHVVDDGLRPDQLLTITFTRRAAANMKERIVSRLVGLGLREMAQIAETGPIQTIHGFCERFLRENALAAGIDPDFEVVESAEGGIADAIWKAVAQTGDDEEEIQRFLEEVAGQAERHRTYDHAKLAKIVTDVLERFRQSGKGPDLLEYSHRSVASLRQLWDEELLVGLDPRALSLLESMDTKLSLPAKLVEAYRIGKIPNKPEYIRPSTDADANALLLSCGLVQLVARTWRIWEADMRNNGQIDLSGLERESVKLLQSSGSVQRRIRKQYEILLVDESQDLNPTQYDLLQGLGIERIMRVGDPQQSIYGFREADPELFRENLGFAPVRLSLNKRTETTGVLRFVDKVFGHIWGESYVAMHRSDVVIELSEYYAGVEFWVQGDDDSRSTAEGVAELISEGTNPGDIAILTRTNGFASRVVRALDDRGIGNRVVGGSEGLYARMEVRDLANALRAIADPYDDFALLATLRSPAVGLSLDSIMLLGRLTPIVETLEVFVCPVTEDSEKLGQFIEWFKPLSTYGDRLSAWEALSEVFSKSPYLVKLAERRNGHKLVANARKLLSLASSRMTEGPKDFANRIRRLERIQHKESEAPLHDEEDNLVTITTIHKAKGLEWPIVVLPEMIKGRNWKAKVQELEVDAARGLAVFDPEKRSSYAGMLNSRRREKEVDELFRVLYVALTRPVKKLCVTISPKAGQESLARPIIEALGIKRGEYPPGSVIRDFTAGNLTP